MDHVLRPLDHRARPGPLGGRAAARAGGRDGAQARRPAGRRPCPGWPTSCPLQAGSTYAVDSASLALALAAGASRAGEWVGFAGCADFGAEAAAELGDRAVAHGAGARPGRALAGGDRRAGRRAAGGGAAAAGVGRASGPRGSSTPGCAPARPCWWSTATGPGPRPGSASRSPLWTGPASGHRAAGGAACPRRRTPRGAAAAARRPDLAGSCAGRAARRAGEVREHPAGSGERADEGDGGVVPRLVGGRRARGGRGVAALPRRRAARQRRRGVQRPRPGRGRAPRAAPPRRPGPVPRAGAAAGQPRPRRPRLRAGPGDRRGPASRGGRAASGPARGPRARAAGTAPRPPPPRRPARPWSRAACGTCGSASPTTSSPPSRPPAPPRCSRGRSSPRAGPRRSCAACPCTCCRTTAPRGRELVGLLQRLGPAHAGRPRRPAGRRGRAPARHLRRLRTSTGPG